MAVRMRLKRMGAKKRPFYRLVVADSRSPRDGRIIESLGYYNPLTDPVTIVVDEEKTKTWLGQGAQPSETVRRLLKVAGVLPGGNGAQAVSEDNGAEEAQSEGEVS